MPDSHVRHSEPVLNEYSFDLGRTPRAGDMVSDNTPIEGGSLGETALLHLDEHLESSPDGGVDDLEAFNESSFIVAPSPARQYSIDCETSRASAPKNVSFCDDFDDRAWERDSNISVLVRVKPLQSYRRCEHLSVISDSELSISRNRTDSNSRKRRRLFQFDRVFSPGSVTSTIYESNIKYLVSGVLNGYNSTVLAYGATGAGKTYTMFGETSTSPKPNFNSGYKKKNLKQSMPREDKGIVGMLLTDLFLATEAAEKASRSKGCLDLNFLVKFSFFEVYNENIRDLLTRSGGVTNTGGELPQFPGVTVPDVSLTIGDDPNRGVVISNLEQRTVTSLEDVLELIAEGTSRRVVEETRSNSASSRSHAILQIVVEKEEILEEKARSGALAQCNTTFGKITLIDLAGSEKATANVDTNQVQRQFEGSNINKSLLALGNCIKALRERDQGRTRNNYVPYRDSKLTRILKDSLAGNCKTVMIAAISQLPEQTDETINTLNYASRAMLVENRLKKNQLKKQLQIGDYVSMVRRLHQENQRLLSVVKGKTCDSYEETHSCGKGLAEGSSSARSCRQCGSYRKKVRNLTKKLNVKDRVISSLAEEKIEGVNTPLGSARRYQPIRNRDQRKNEKPPSSGRKKAQRRKENKQTRSINRNKEQRPWTRQNRRDKSGGQHSHRQNRRLPHITKKLPKNLVQLSARSARNLELNAENSSNQLATRSVDLGLLAKKQQDGYETDIDDFNGNNLSIGKNAMKRLRRQYLETGLMLNARLDNEGNFREASRNVQVCLSYISQLEDMAKEAGCLKGTLSRLIIPHDVNTSISSASAGLDLQEKIKMSPIMNSSSFVQDNQGLSMASEDDSSRIIQFVKGLPHDERKRLVERGHLLSTFVRVKVADDADIEHAKLICTEAKSFFKKTFKLVEDNATTLNDLVKRLA